MANNFARQKGKNTAHGLAAVNSASSYASKFAGGGGAEAEAMIKKSANDNHTDEKETPKPQAQQPTRPSGASAPTPVTKNRPSSDPTPAPTTTKPETSGAQSSPIKRGPNDGSDSAAPPKSTTQNPQTPQTATEIIRASLGLQTPANNNQKENKTVNTNTTQKIDPKTGLPVDNRTPGPFGGRERASESQTGLGEAGETIAKATPGSVADLLSDPTRIRNRDNVQSTEEYVNNPANDNQSDEERLLNEQERLRQLQLLEELSEEERLAQEQAELENQNLQVHQNPPVQTVEFPFIMLAVTTAEYLAFLVFSIIGAVLTIVVTPLGGIIDTILYFWQIGFGVFVLVWSIGYSKNISNMVEIKNKLKKKKSRINFSTRRKWVKFTKKFPIFKIFNFALNLVPILDALYPGNILTVVSTYRQAKKDLEQE